MIIADDIAAQLEALAAREGQSAEALLRAWIAERTAQESTAAESEETRSPIGLLADIEAWGYRSGRGDEERDYRTIFETELTDHVLRYRQMDQDDEIRDR
jgi:hypothetical protein